ncbi:hypothetical protein A4U88_3229 [Serratia marcescens]|nr:hypothetical protein A4U88_3229 [Serratia marcescens]
MQFAQRRLAFADAVLRLLRIDNPSNWPFFTLSPISTYSFSNCPLTCAPTSTLRTASSWPVANTFCCRSRWVTFTVLKSVGAGWRKCQTAAAAIAAITARTSIQRRLCPLNPVKMDLPVLVNIHRPLRRRS